MWVCGYGSLAAPDPRARAVTLRSARRVWGVAMDNTVDLPGYKHYEDPETGERPAVYVAFLDLAPADDGAAIDIVCHPVGADELDVLDARERNYDRVDVADRIDGDLDGPVWAYDGSPAGRARLAAGRAAGSAVVVRGYLEAVRAGYEALGLSERFDASTEPPPFPVVDLARIDHG